MGLVADALDRWDVAWARRYAGGLPPPVAEPMGLVIEGFARRLPEPEFPRLAAMLRSPDPDERKRAVVILGNIGPRAVLATQALRAALDDPDPSVRLCATYALATVTGASF